MFSEIAVRRRRLRESLGDRGQTLVDFLVMSGLVLGSLGLFLRPWMIAAAPWGFALPAVYFGGLYLLEARRQQSVKRGVDATAIGPRYDWGVTLWGVACAVAGAAAFVIAWNAEPPPPPEPEAWTPPEEGVIEMDLNETPIPRVED